MDPESIKTRAEFAQLLRLRLVERQQTMTQVSIDLAANFKYKTLMSYLYATSFPNSKEKLMVLCAYLGIDPACLDLSSIIAKNRIAFGLEPRPIATPLDSKIHLELLDSNPSSGNGVVLRPRDVPKIYFSGGEFPGYKINGEPGMIVGESPEMQRVFDLLFNINNNPDQESVVLVTGETGTGKELVAKAIHYNSRRRNSPFVGINITTVTETLLESELFGHKRGSFTDARFDKEGFFETVQGGTLFLDEIGSLHPIAQAKLLRVLQEKYFYRVGDTKSRLFNGRIIVATKEDLEKLVNERKFRNDLYYRINVINVELPKLKNREVDIPLLFSFFVQKYNKRYGRDYDTMPSPVGFDSLLGYTFPGNVRELEHLITKAIFAYPESKVVRIEEAIKQIRNTRTDLVSDNNLSPADLFAERAMEGVEIQGKIEKEKVKSILKSYFESGANLTKCGIDLGMTRRQVAYSLSVYGLEPKILERMYSDS